MASVSKIAPLLVTALFYDRSLIPPTLPPSEDEQKRIGTNDGRNIGWYEGIIIPIIPLWTRMSYWAFTATEAMLILTPALDNHSSFTYGVTKFIRPYDFVGRVTIPFILGACLIVAGASIRFRCFRQMGRHFTFALSLRDGHSLITNGPYSVVRHPAYTGGNMTILGAALTLMGNGSWWFGGGYNTGWGIFLALNFTVSSLLIVHGFLRGANEDRYLKASFGEKWERFAEQVPYRYIPGLC